MKKMLVWLLSGLVLETGAFAAGVSDSVVDLGQGLVAFFPFNGNSNDESGNKHNGRAHYLTFTTDRLGTPNSAASFNGKYSLMEIPNNRDFDFGKTTSFTISYWVRLNTIPVGTFTMLDASSMCSIELNTYPNRYFGFRVRSQSGEKILMLPMNDGIISLP
jgi:hypothetical protein